MPPPERSESPAPVRSTFAAQHRELRTQLRAPQSALRSRSRREVTAAAQPLPATAEVSFSAAASAEIFSAPRRDGAARLSAALFPAVAPALREIVGRALPRSAFRHRAKSDDWAL